MSRVSRWSDAILSFAVLPLSALWLLCAVGVIGGLVEWIVLDGSPREGFMGAATIAGLTMLVARVTGVPAWPWSYRRDSAHE